MLTVPACAAIPIAGCGGGDSTTGSETGESSATQAKPVVKYKTLIFVVDLREVG